MLDFCAGITFSFWWWCISMNSSKWRQKIQPEQHEGAVNPRKPEEHILCGTCFGEYERGINDRGLQQGLDRTMLQRISHDVDHDDVCCVCGQISAPEVKFLMAVEDLPDNWCKGEHPQLRDAEGKCGCGTNTAYAIWDFVDDLAVDVAAKCNACEKPITLEWTDGESES